MNDQQTINDERPPFDPSLIRAVLFDAYGTVLDYGAPHFRAAIATIIANQGIDVDFEDFHRSWIDAYSPSGVWGTESPSRNQPYRDEPLNGRLPKWHSQWEIWRRQFVAAFKAHEAAGSPSDAANFLREELSCAEPFDDTRKCIDSLRRSGYIIGLLSNADDDFLQSALSTAQLEFSVVLSSESLRAYKPHRSVFLTACNDLSTFPHETLYVGDSPIADVGGAHNAGLRTVWVRRSGKDHNAENSLKPSISLENDQHRPKATTAEMMARLPKPDLTVESLLEIINSLNPLHIGQ